MIYIKKSIAKENKYTVYTLHTCHNEYNDTKNCALHIMLYAVYFAIVSGAFTDFDRNSKRNKEENFDSEDELTSERNRLRPAEPRSPLKCGWISGL
jgi:hypothetical protein